MRGQTNPFLELAAPGIEALKPYLPGKPISELERELGISRSIKLASNENPLGVSEKVIEAIAGCNPELSRYPDGGAFQLRQRLAEMHGVDPGCITLGNGSNDVLDMVARVFLSPGVESLFSQYAFAVYPISSQAAGAKLVIAPAREYGHDLDRMLQMITPKTRVIWIANPNNPTGTWLSRDELLDFLTQLPDHVILVLDEAYFEYVQESDYPDGTAWLARFPNLIVTRTFSKAYGLASLRIGYGISNPDLADLLNRVRQPFNVNTPAQSAALAALEDQAFIQRSIALNSRGMQQYRRGFERLGLDAIPSVANFITVDVAGEASRVDQALLREGCITRPVANYGMPNHLRISIGLDEENDRLLATLAKVLKPRFRS
ncbi:MAG: histidinol-phosphate transaminase [Candidatus Thiodiazotropha sp. (ex Ctena orbiculata)]|uniref:Histidinol-phosphate aminotransferase n=1 Tax=Candidatus Thiodiazotropha taylori TaxID=2792791 RepID=A0A944M9I6_9GAMM|nr:histidinol-phosphate transaminase [Candidatus Thiodiazotropha taylori]PUB81687.1 MAG: histidinol-phosphate transaminase [gamma proteobacterium symbiont of Ctena orbiculata]MBT2988674.1 histidinol-phosphate transaminase [Candidatus Thiodiazotropha taylori]MBT2996757.1 histidinol-phosphate transaminase [Candidatus Thiodiazotropha taylori]MBT3001990.1 histidinol-phosphate transaminase [Candidatus Thiodiazotropha taylori]